MNKENAVYVYIFIGMLFSHKREGNFAIFNIRGGPQRYYGK